MNEDKELIKKTLGGEKKAFEMIIQKYQTPLFNYIARMVGDRELALDFTQEVFVRTYTSLKSYDPQYKFSTWLYKIASNHIIDFWRKKKITAISIDQKSFSDNKSLTLQIPSDEPSIVKKFEISELKDKIETLLEKIPLALRELFIWRHVNEFSYEEIAEIKGMPVGTIKNRVFQAKEKIRNLLEETS
ncbi:RNA polymerase sigma factor [Acidobacteriota bacterium]